MAPPFRSLLIPRGEFDTSLATEEFWQQWVNPGDVFSILLILGGDIVALALAQLAGSGFTPVSFSFGWVAYSISALVCALGSNKLMPKSTDCDCKVINGNTGYSRENSSWVLGRLVRDFEHWTHPETHARLERNWMELRRRDPSATRPQKIGLVVTVYQPSRVDVPKQPRKDWLYWSGVVVMFVQLGIAAIPLGLFGDWGIMLVTAAGIVLSVATGYIPQWRSEKWACRTGSKSSYILTEGNGAQHAFIVLGNQLGLNLEDLATGQNGVGKGKNKSTWIISSILAILWIMLLIAATALKEHTWYLLAVGGLGIVQNIVVAGWSRKPAALGIPLEYVSVHGHPSVMETLFSVEKAYPNLGRSMRDEFFPGKLRPEEELKWNRLEREAVEKSSSEAERSRYLGSYR